MIEEPTSRRDRLNPYSSNEETTMRIWCGILVASACAFAAVVAVAQPPREGNREGRGAGEAPEARLFAFDANKDGKLTKDEVTDERLRALFDRADGNKDGSVTREELVALLAQEAQTGRGQRGPGGAGGPPGGNRGPGGQGPGGPGGGGPGGRGFGGPPQPGQILPPFVREGLELTADQTKQLDDLQKEVDARLAKILTDEQKQRLHEMQSRGPGGGTGGFGGPNGPEGRPGGNRPGRPPGQNSPAF
jgi:hypothetical protein